jgi:asparagine synthase (glutamine-hydrolysing)
MDRLPPSGALRSPPMCGIAGLLYFDPERGVDPALLDRMTDVLTHRGPDGRGVHIDGNLGLGHRRLAIIDLSEDAAQPMCNEDGTVWVALNGEIYNFQELRDELLAKGHTFKSRSDTEVLVHLYEEHGEDLVDHLRGMFAFALWDARARRLLLARDRFGQKPVYYRLTPEGLHFGSEIKAILQDTSVERVADRLGLHGFLTYGYVHGPGTAFEGIKRLQPGHVLRVDASGAHQLRRYWRLTMSPKREVAPGDAGALRRAADELLGVLDEATRLRMISDVPLGAFLSGGVDSSAIVASMCAARGSGAGVRTFAIGFDEPDYDESGYAARVAGRLGTEHTCLNLTPDAFGGLDNIVWHYGEPYADASCLPTFAVSKLARQHVTVALTGDGGDELLCGYRRHVATRIEERLRGSHPLARQVVGNRVLLSLLSRAGWTDLAGQLAHAFLYNPDLPPSDLYLSRVEQVSSRLKAELYTAGLASDTGRDAREWLRQAIAASDGTTFTERCAHGDAVTYLPDDILVKVDVASMAYGLECRAPLLDHRLAELIGRLPFSFKMHRLETKRVLKAAVRGRIGDEPVSRAKMGFGVPLGTWFQGRLDAHLRDVLLDPRALDRGLFKPDVVRRLLDDHARGAVDYQKELFCLLMLELWHREWIDPPQGSLLRNPHAATAATPAS